MHLQVHESGSNPDLMQVQCVSPNSATASASAQIVVRDSAYWHSAFSAFALAFFYTVAAACDPNPQHKTFPQHLFLIIGFRSMNLSLSTCSLPTSTTLSYISSTPTSTKRRWVNQPNERENLNIIWSCVATLAICE